MAITKLNSLAIPPNTIVESDLSYPLTNFSSTGIDDNATSTAVTIDSSENVGIGTDSPANNSLTIEKTGTARLRLTEAGVRSWDIEATSGSWRVNNASNSIEAMRIDLNGNVGIASTNTGGFKLDVAGTARANNLVFRADTSTPSGDAAIFRPATSSLALSTNSTERMRIDASGNVGINATVPSAFNQVTGQGRLVIGGGAADEGMTIYSSASNSGSIAFADGASGTAQWRGVVQYVHSDDSMRFFTTNTLRMAIDSSGNVDLSANVGSTLTFQRTGSADGNGVIRSTGSGGVENARITLGGGSNNALIFGTGSSGTERMRITSSGRININHQTSGTAGTGSFIVGANSFYIQASQNSSSSTRVPIVFSAIGGTNESMRIDSSGNLLVGCTAVPSASVAGFAVRDLSNGWIHTSYDSTNTRTHHNFFNPNGSVGTIQTSGSSTLYNTSSDQRLKDNIVDAPAGNIDAIRVRSFDWKTDGTHQTYGMVAQELVDVAPEAVSQGETEDDMWGVDYSKLVPMMIKEIQDLKAEVAALKGA